jgi:hypothetical protein
MAQSLILPKRKEEGLLSDIGMSSIHPKMTRKGVTKRAICITEPRVMARTRSQWLVRPSAMQVITSAIGQIASKNQNGQSLYTCVSNQGDDDQAYK